MNWFQLTYLLDVMIAIVVEKNRVILISTCKNNLVAFKIPKRGFVMDLLPKVATGKI